MSRTIAIAALAFFSSLPMACAARAGSDPAVQDQPTRRERWRARREARQQNADEWRSAWTGLSAADREAIADAVRQSIDRLRNLTPEQRQQLVNAAEGLAQQLRNLSPEQKAQLQDWLRRAAESYQGLTPEQKREMLANIADGIDRLRGLRAGTRATLQALYRRLVGV